MARRLSQLVMRGPAVIAIASTTFLIAPNRGAPLDVAVGAPAAYIDLAVSGPAASHG